jgi:selenoprotein W-related protein
VGLAENLLAKHKNKISSLNIIPSSGGVFEVKLGDELLFSKKTLGRFPNDNEVEQLVNEKL